MGVASTENDKVVFIVSQTSAMRERLTQIITILLLVPVVLRGLRPSVRSVK